MHVEFSLSMPPEMLDWIDEARDENESREQFIRECIRAQTIYKQVENDE